MFCLLQGTWPVSHASQGDCRDHACAVVWLCSCMALHPHPVPQSPSPCTQRHTSVNQLVLLAVHHKTSVLWRDVCMSSSLRKHTGQDVGPGDCFSAYLFFFSVSGSFNGLSFCSTSWSKDTEEPRDLKYVLLLLLLLLLLSMYCFCF